MLPFPGVIAMEERFAAFTFSEVLLVIAPEVAEISVFPRLVPVASPLVVIDAMLGADEFHTTVLVMSCIVPSENVPVAVKGCSTPSGMEMLIGASATDVSAAFVTVRFATPETLPDVAVIVELPGVNPFAVPSVGKELLTVATLEAEELHVAVLVTSCVLPSVNVPVALKLVVVSAAIDAAGGTTAIVTTFGGATVSVVAPLTPSKLAETVDVPCPTVVASPDGVTVAAAAFELFHATDAVRSLALPSLYLPVAWNCCVNPAATEGLFGLIWIACRLI